MNLHMLRWAAGPGLALLGTTWASLVLAQNQPALVIDDVTVPEGNSGSVVATFKVRFADSTPHGAAIVFFTTTAGTATAGSQCGASGVDYVSLTGLASVTFSASEFSKAINIAVCGDTRDEPDQTFFVNITARGAAIQDPQGQATIIDDDPPPVLNISDGKVTEGNAGAIVNGGFTVTLTGSTENSVSVKFATVDRSAIGGHCGTPGVDYETTSRSLTYLPNRFSPSTTTLAVVRVCGDDVSEGDQQFEIQLSNATNATIQDGTGVFTITDDEPLPTLAITSTVLVNEPSAQVPQVDAVFTVKLTGPRTEQPVSVQYATAPGTASAGSSCSGSFPGADYITQIGKLTFITANSTQQIRVPICADSVTLELNETFTVTLLRAANAVITQAVGTATIR